MLQNGHFDDLQAKRPELLERRRYVRRIVPGVEVVVIVEPGAQIGTWETARLLDLSGNGMAIRAPKPLRAGQRLITEFHLPGTDICARPNCKVVWGDGSGKAGIRFLEIEEPLKFLLAQWAHAHDDRPGNTNSQAEPACPADATPRDAATVYDFGKLHANLGLEHGGALPLLEALPGLVEQVSLLTNSDGVAVALRSDDGGMICRASVGSAPEVGARLDPDSGLSGECVRTGKLVTCSDVSNDPRVHLSAAQDLNTRSMMIVPIMLKGSIAGVLEVFSSRVAAFSSAQVPGLELVAELIGSLAEQAQSTPPTVFPPDIPRREPVLNGPAGNPETVAVAVPSKQLQSAAESAAANLGPERIKNESEEDWTKAILLDTMPSPDSEKPKEKVESADLSFRSGTAGEEERKPDPMGPLRSILTQRPPPPGPFLSRISTGMKYAVLAFGLLLVLIAVWALASRFLLPLAKEQYADFASDISRRLAATRDSGLARNSQVPFVSGAAAQRQAIVQPAPILPGFSRYPEGEVVLSFNIGPDGAVNNLQIVSGNPILAQAAVAAVRKWRYRPFIKDGKPIEVATRVTVRYPFLRR